MIKILCFEDKQELEAYDKYLNNPEETIESITIKPAVYIPCSVLIRTKSGEEFYAAKILSNTKEIYSEIEQALINEMKERTTIDD